MLKEHLRSAALEYLECHGPHDSNTKNIFPRRQSVPMNRLEWCERASKYLENPQEEWKRGHVNLLVNYLKFSDAFYGTGIAGMPAFANSNEVFYTDSYKNQRDDFLAVIEFIRDQIFPNRHLTKTLGDYS